MNLDKADKAFSDYIRQKDADDNGYNYCYTCGLNEYWKYLQCGHFVPRENLLTRFDERNAKPQCSSCNMFERGHVARFRNFLVKEYSEKIVEELEMARHTEHRMMQHEVDEIEQHYKDKIKELIT